jgi:uncharacterized protein with HEPN domain
MSINNIQKFLEDILTSINNIEASTAGLEAKHYNNYEISWIVERGIEIIAEAFKRIFVLDKEIIITNSKKIIATRNKITHEYDVIDHYQLYLIVSKYLPLLKKEIESILLK